MSQTPDSHSDTDSQIYARLLSYVLPYWLAFVFSIVGFILYSLSNVGFVQLIAVIIDSLGGSSTITDSPLTKYFSALVDEGEEMDRVIIPLMIFAIAMLRGLGTLIGNYFISIVGTNLVHNLRVEIFDRLLLLPSRFYDKNSMGHLVAKVTFHVSQVTGAATDAVRVLIREGFTVIAYLIYLFLLNWKLTLIFIAVAPLIAIVVGFAARRFRRISERIQNSMGDVTHVASEAMQGYKEVRTFGGLDYERQRFFKVSNNNRKQSMKMVITSSISTPVVQQLVALAMAALVWLALDPELSGTMSGGYMVAFIVTGGLLAKPIRQLSQINATIQKGLAAAENIFALFDEEIEPDEGSKELKSIQGKIEFRDVSFAYDNDNETPVLKNVSFVANPGETIALVGKSGSGKSTLASLILRFYSPSSGSILLDGEPIDNLTLKNLREHLAIVTQDVTLFNDSVAKNIAYGALRDKKIEDIQAAAEKAFAWSFIQELQNGMETIVGDDGVLLSGGQRQRLAIARAFLKDAPILILDEATSALDSESERYIQLALEEVSKGRTTIVIAHRLSTIENADRILVLDGGEIVEQGSHDELIAKGQHYANLHNHRVEPESARHQPTTSSVLDLKGHNPVESKDWLPNTYKLFSDAWYSDANWVKLFLPIAYIYSGLAGLKRKLTRVWLAPVPVIIVGNINIGGTGKSPLVAYLVKQLIQNGYKPGVVSRGYGGRAEHYPLAVSPLTGPSIVGDEAVMLARKIDCPIVVDPNRPNAVKFLLEKYDCDLVISDDGLQHYALDRDVEIAVFDATRGLGNGLCLPAGPLREPASRLDEVDFVVVNGRDDPQLGREYCVMELEPCGLANLKTDALLDRPLSSNTVHAVAGIGNPDRFFKTLKSLGYELIEHSFDDHHSFDLADLSFGDNLPVVMTEKDAVKCRLLSTSLIHENFWYLRVDVKIADDFLPAIMAKLGLHPQALKQGIRKE